MAYIPLAAAGIGAAGSVLGSMIGSNAASKAAKQQAKAAQEAQRINTIQYNQSRQDQAPWRNAGTTALGELMYQLGLGDNYSIYDTPATDTSEANFDSARYLREHPDVADPRAWNPAKHSVYDHWLMYGKNQGAPFPALVNPYRTTTTMTGASQTQHSGDYGSLMKPFDNSVFEKDPGYQFRMDEGLKGVESSAAARGMGLSGAALKDITRWGQDFASNEYGNAYNRYNNDQNNRYQRLATVAGFGQGAANQNSAASQNYASTSGSNITGYGNARSAGTMAQGNSWVNGLNNLSSYAMLYGMTQPGQSQTTTPNPGVGANGSLNYTYDPAQYATQYDSWIPSYK